MAIRTKINPMGSGLKTYLLSLNTSGYNCYCYFTYNGISYSLENGQSIPIKSGETISYTVYSRTYGRSISGTVTMYANRTIYAYCYQTSSTSTSYQLDNDITIVNSPSITSTGELSSLSINNFLHWNSSSYSTSSWEIQIRFKYSATGSASQTVFGHYVNAQPGIEPHIRVLSTNKLQITIGGKIITNSYSLSANTWYTVKLSCSNSDVSLYVNNSFISSTSITNMVWKAQSCIGCERYTSGQSGAGWANRYGAIYCTIDLLNTYVKSNGTKVIDNTKTTTIYSYNWSHYII